MGELKDKISDEIKTAMKARDKVRLNVLRYLKKLFIENDTSGKPQPELDIVISHAKKMQDSLKLFPDGSVQAADVQAELTVLSEFLPSQLEESEVREMVLQIKQGLENPNMGAIMKELSGQIKGRFDGKKASQLVQEILKS